LLVRVKAALGKTMQKDAGTSVRQRAAMNSAVEANLLEPRPESFDVTWGTEEHPNGDLGLNLDRRRSIMVIGDRLKELRESKELSQGDIEKRTGLLRC
jgi:hypothetical protein